MASTYDWHESYRAALLETAWTKIRQRIQVAELTINQSNVCCPKITAVRPRKGKRLTLPFTV